MKLTFVTKEDHGAGVGSFWFQPQEPVAWRAGQSIKLELPAGYGVEERRFTISSAPFEKRIRITTRVSSSKFKQALNNLQPGDTVQAFSIDGSFVWQDASEQHVFGASGIGVTPFISMLRQRQHDGQPLTARLAYGAPRGQWVFRDELERLAHEHEAFSVEFITGELSVDKLGGTGLVYLCGPAPTVDRLSADLQQAGVAPARIQRDWFTGRTGWDVE